MNFKFFIMHKIVTLSIFLGLFQLITVDVSAQRGRMQSRMDQINAEKIAFFTERMALTEAEAKVFWPVYNEFWSKREGLFAERRRLSNQFRKNRENLSEKETEQLLEAFIELQKQEARLTEDYHLKFMKILPAEKVMIFYLSESEFRNYLLRRLSGGGRGGGPARPGNDGI
jgi:hypothetical protein